AVALVVLRGVDAALRRDRVGPTGAVLVAEALDVVPLLPQRRRGGGTGQAGADDDDGQLAPVRRVDQGRLELAGLPLLGDVAGRGLGVPDGRALAVEALDQGVGHVLRSVLSVRAVVRGRVRTGWPTAAP